MQINDLNLLSSGKKYLSFSDKTPCFLYEKRILKKKAADYKSAIKKCDYPVRPYYAMKSNGYPPLLAELVRLGFGLDASSPRELKLAKEAKAKKIIYTGPGKTRNDLSFALKTFKNIEIHLDSFEDLNNLISIASRPVRICVRINTVDHGGWKKFGIPIVQIKRFYHTAKTCKNIAFSGIHFHNSWNKDSLPYIKTLKSLARYLKNNFSQAEIQDFKILDIGGGLYTDRTEGELIIEKGRKKDFFSQVNGYTLIKSQTINKVIKDLEDYLKKSIFNTIDGLSIYTEPGRWLSTHCFQILLKVIDIKDKQLVILDGGTENFGYLIKDIYYFPIYNLSRPAKREKKIILAGSLCSIDDIWGYYCHMKDIKKDDIMLLPFQGAYTYSYAKDFIRPFPRIEKIE